MGRRAEDGWINMTLCFIYLFIHPCFHPSMDGSVGGRIIQWITSIDLDEQTGKYRLNKNEHTNELNYIQNISVNTILRVTLLSKRDHVIMFYLRCQVFFLLSRQRRVSSDPWLFVNDVISSNNIHSALETMCFLCKPARERLHSSINRVSISRFLAQPSRKEIHFRRISSAAVFQRGNAIFI